MKTACAARKINPGEFEIYGTFTTHKYKKNRKPIDKNLNSEKLKSYFLGKLPEAENDSFEEEIALDAQLTETAQTVESELIDDYLRGNLSASDRALFERVYLNGEARREKLLFARSLWRAANEPEILEITAASTEETSPSFWQIWRLNETIRIIFRP